MRNGCSGMQGANDSFSFGEARTQCIYDCIAQINGYIGQGADSVNSSVNVEGIIL